MIQDALRAKLNLIVVATVAFAVGLGLAAKLDLTPTGLAAGRTAGLEPIQMQIGAPEGQKLDVTLADGFSEIAESISPAVVTIQVQRRVSASAGPLRLPPGFNLPPGFEEDGERLLPSSGSGVIISEDGYIITNNHVVEGSEGITVQLADRREFENVTVVGADRTTDVALLKIDASGLAVAPLGDSDATRVGEWVLAIGSPGFVGSGLLRTTVTAGIVSAIGRNIGIIGAANGTNLAIEDFIQTDAAINPGNSGGPLVNARGEVIGINTAIASETGAYVGYGFAVPIDLVREVVDDLVEHGEVRRAILGVEVSNVDDEIADAYGLSSVSGVMIQNISNLPGGESPAARAGLRPGDVIVGVEGEQVSTVNQLQRRIRSYEPGETVEVDVVRRPGNRRDAVRVTLAAVAPPEADASPHLASAASSDPMGVEVAPLSSQFRSQHGVPDDVEGVVVTGTEPNGAFADKVGFLMRNDRGQVVEIPWIIQDINGRKIAGVRDYEEAIGQLEPGAVASLLLYNPISERTAVASVRIPS